MKTKKRILISVIFSLIVFCFSNLHAQSTGLEFLNIAPGARSAGMGEAFTPLADDLNAVIGVQISRKQMFVVSC
ncbi:MAG: hypothetical protein ABIA17_01850 [Elusimicrobiota bacterium]